MSILRQKKSQKVGWPRRVLLGLLVAGLLGVLPTASLAADEEKVPLPTVSRKPEVTIQGNAVIDEAGKPTGFYELALCVQTEFIVDNATGKVVTKAEYEEAIAKAADKEAAKAKYTFVNSDHRFRSVATTLTVNTDVLTPVTWDADYPKYDTWDGTAYASTNDHDYNNAVTKGIRGISVADNAEWLDAVPDITKAELGKSLFSVGLDTAKPDEVSVASARVEGFDKTNHRAVLTMAAGLQLGGQSYADPTPVVVIRFSYDLKRFPDVLLSKGNVLFDVADTAANVKPGTTPLTYLSSDSEAARSTVNQSVWYEMYMDPAGNEFTSFYYYHGANDNQQKLNDEEFSIKGEANKVNLFAPETQGKTVLADNAAGNDTGIPGRYSFFHNLLRPLDGTLKFEYVNQTTYRKPTGVVGVMILYYDWDDSLIGAQMVAPKGDVRAQVNEYVERNFIHPELRTSGHITAAGGDKTALVSDPYYEDLTESLARDHTYRGEYAYTVGEDTNTDKIFGNDSAQPGSEYPLTNKLDYAFYRRPTTMTELEEFDGSGKTITRRYYTVDTVKDGPAVMPEDEEYTGYLYPYVNGWALVEDNSGINQDNWMVRRDAKLTESVWTTFGVGELENMDPKGAQTFTDQGGQVNHYAYSTTNQDDAWYLRFADFSDIGALLKPGQDTVIVKAVYEPGDSLLPTTHYTVDRDSLYVERYGYAASTGDSVYSFKYQYRRANNATGSWQGVRRTREPAVQTGYTYDVNAFDTEDRNLNPASDTKMFSMKTVTQNRDILDIDITTGGVLWRVNYVLLDVYGRNIASGLQRSAGLEFTQDQWKYNFLYEDDTIYAERQGTDGYVLEATLNTLLDEATKAANNQSSTLASHFSLATVNDLNLRADVDGKAFTALNYTRCTSYLQDLVTRLYRSNNPAYRDKNGNITLGWHQIQRHILMCMQAGKVVNGIFDGTTLTSEADCAGFLWCRLDECAKDITVDILDWHDVLLAFQKVEEGNTKAQEALDKLLDTGNTILTSPAFRRTEDGALFGPNNDNRADIRTAMENAYKVLKAAGITSEDDLSNISWQEMQYLLINGAYKPGGANYWWENGGKMPIRNWNDLIRAGCLVVRSTDKVPDALDALADKDAGFLSQYVTYAAPTGSPANVGWFRDHYSDEDDNAFPDIATFQTKWLKALTELGKHYNLPDDWNTISWYEIQYALIEGKYATEAYVLGNTNYWWKDGGMPKLTYEKLLAAANEYRASGYTDSSELDRLLTKGINPVNNEVYLRRTVAGSGFTTVASFKTALRNALSIIDYTSNASTLVNAMTGDVEIDIYQMQYLILNGNKLVGKDLPSSQDIQDTAGYWWIPEPHVPTSAQAINDIMDLLTYAYWKRDGVDGNNLDFALDKLDVATMERLHLRPEAHGIPYTDETNIQLVNAVLAVLNKLPYTIDTIGGQTAADLTKEVQYLLLNPGAAYKSAGSITDNYWWQKGGFTVEDQTQLLQAAWITNVGFGGKTATDAANGINDLDFITRRTNIVWTGLALRAGMDGTGFGSLNLAKAALATAVQKLSEAGYTYDTLNTVTQHQLQYLLINGVYKTDAEVKAEVIVDGVDAYWWFTMDSPPVPQESKEEIPLEDGLWDKFLNCAMEVYKKKAGNTTGFNTYPLADLTNEHIETKLLLRVDADGNTIELSDFFDTTSATTVKAGRLWEALDYMQKNKGVDESGNAVTFISGSLTRSWSTKPTWEQFQWVLIHMRDTTPTAVPSVTDCEAWANQKDVPWAWQEKTT